MVDVQTALDLIEESVQPVQEREKAGIDGITGRILAEPVEASEDFPGYDNSAMDGFVFRKSDLERGERIFPVAFEIRPEDRQPEKLRHGTAAYITTGSAIPEGGNIVIPVEMTRKSGNENVEILELPARNPIRKKGEGYRKDDVLLHAGKQLTSVDIGILKSNGYGEVSLFQKTRIALQVTGNELDERRNTNGPVLKSWLESLPSVTVDEFPPLADDMRSMERQFGELLDSFDLIVTTGGVSAGAYDLVIPAFESHGVTFPVRGVRQKPGKPFSFGFRESTLVTALPGNPVSAFACAVIYISRIIGSHIRQPAADQVARLRNEFTAKSGRDEFVPAEILFDDTVRTVRTHSSIQSHLLHHLSAADCLAHFESGRRYLPGDIIPVIPIYG